MSGDDRIIFDPSEKASTSDGAQVIQLADVRIARGWSRPSKVCRHLSLVYSPTDRRVECKDCNQPIDGFDAFMVTVRHFQDMDRAAQVREAKAREALNAVLVRRAAKALDRAWGRRMAPCCPHCDRGLLAQDFADGRAAVSAELEVARRKRADLEGAEE